MFLITKPGEIPPTLSEDHIPIILLADQAAVDKWLEKETQKHNCSSFSYSTDKQEKVKVVCFYVGDEVIDSYNIFPVKVG